MMMLQRYCVNFDDDDLYATVYVERMVNELRQKRGCSQFAMQRWQSQMIFLVCNLTFIVTFRAIQDIRGRTNFKLLIGNPVIQGQCRTMCYQ